MPCAVREIIVELIDRCIALITAFYFASYFADVFDLFSFWVVNLRVTSIFAEIVVKRYGKATGSRCHDLCADGKNGDLSYH